MNYVSRSGGIFVVLIGLMGSPAMTSAASTSDTTLALTTPSVTLSDAIHLALLQNPALVTWRKSTRVADAARGVAQTYPHNPFVQTQVLPYASAALGAPAHYVLLMQTIELGGQGRHREEQAQASLLQTQWSVRHFETLTTTQVAHLFFTALYERGLCSILKHQADLAEQRRLVLQRRVPAGQASTTDLTLAQIVSTTAHHEADAANMAYAKTVMSLSHALGLPANQRIDLAGDLTQWTWRPAPSIAATQQAKRPDVMAAEAAVVASRAGLDLARSSRIPNVQIGPYYQRTPLGIVSAGIRAQFELPVFNSGQPLVEQRNAEAALQQSTYEQALDTAQHEAIAAVEHYEQARLLADNMRTSIESVLPVEAQRIEEQYVQSQIDEMRLLTARESVMHTLKMQLDILRDLAFASADLAGALALPFEDLIDTGSGTQQ